ncbi:MAG: hypothetical protein ACJAUV_002180 [Flavobacteriales bacterium]|jgi:hypothetical protein
MLNKRAFQKLTLANKYLSLKKTGHYLATRDFEGYQVYLYAYDIFYVEVWCPLGLDQICWIEVVYNQETIQSYVDDINVFKELGIID